MKPLTIMVTDEVQSGFCAGIKDSNYHHDLDRMRALGRRPVVPAFLLLSKMCSDVLAMDWDAIQGFTVESEFSRIATVGEPIVFDRRLTGDQECFTSHPKSVLAAFNPDPIITVRFRPRDTAVSTNLAANGSGREFRFTTETFQAFARVLGTTDSRLLRGIYLAGYATRLVILSYRDPRNSFEQTVRKLKERQESAPFYHSIHASVDLSSEIGPGHYRFEYEGEITGRNRTCFGIRVSKGAQTLVTGDYGLDFIPKAAVLRFTSHLP